MTTTCPEKATKTINLKLASDLEEQGNYTN